MHTTSPAAPETKSAATARNGRGSETDPIAAIAAEVKSQGETIDRMTRTRAVGTAASRLHEAKMRALTLLRQTADESRSSRRADPLDEQKMARQNAAIDAADDEARRAELAEYKAALAELRKKAARPHGPTGGAANAKAEAIALHRKAVESYLRTGLDIYNGQHLREIEAKALTGERNMEGGYVLAPERDAGPIERYLAMTVAMRRLATVRPIGAYEFVKPLNLGGATSGWAGEREARPETGTPQLAELRFPTHEVYAKPQASQRLLDDAMVDIEAWLADEVQIAFAEKEDIAFVSGNGVTQPDGFLGNASRIVANASWSQGKIGYVASGASGAFATSNPMDSMIDLTTALKTQYRAGAAFMANRSTIGTIRKFKDSTGQYLWQPSQQAGQPGLLLGYTCEESDTMPDIAANAYALAFGDFKRAYLIVDRIGLRVLRNPYTSMPNIEFYTTKRVGGGLQNDEAIKLMKFASS